MNARKVYLEQMQRLAPITKEAWEAYQERNIEELADIEYEEHLD